MRRPSMNSSSLGKRAALLKLANDQNNIWAGILPHVTPTAMRGYLQNPAIAQAVMPMLQGTGLFGMAALADASHMGSRFSKITGMQLPWLQNGQNQPAQQPPAPQIQPAAPAPIAGGVPQPPPNPLKVN